MSDLRTAAVVFDAVGTLMYPDPPVAAAYVAAGRRFGSKLTEREVAGRFHSVFRDMEQRDRGGDLRTSESAEYARWQEIVRRVLDDVTDYAACFEALFDHFARPVSWRVYDDVSPTFLALAARGVRIAIASNFDQRLIEIASRLEPLDLCRPVLVSSQIGFRKPHARFFQAIVEAVGVAPAELLYVGDDPVNDVAGGATAGLRTLLVRRDGEPPCGGLRSLTELVSRFDRP